MPIESNSQSRLSATRKRKLLPLERFSIQFPRCRKEEEESINIKASLKFNYSLSDSDDENIIWVSLNFHPTELTLINERLFKNSILFNQLCKKMFLPSRVTFVLPSQTNKEIWVSLCLLTSLALEFWWNDFSVGFRAFWRDFARSLRVFPCAFYLDDEALIHVRQRAKSLLGGYQADLIGSRINKRSL